MKKLLAMVLCVVMVMSLAPAAFATNTVVVETRVATGTNPPPATLLTTGAANKAVSHAKENIEYMYGTLAADTAVFGTIKSVDSMVSDFAKTLFDGVTDDIFGVPASVVKDNSKVVMRDILGTAIIDYLEDHKNSFTSYSKSLNDATSGNKLVSLGRTNPNGAYLYRDDVTGQIYAASPNGFDADGNQLYNWQSTNGTMAQVLAGTAAWDNATVIQTVRAKYDPIKYANTFTAAVSDAFNGAQNGANIQNMIYQLYSIKVWDDVDDKLDDLADEIDLWEDGTDILRQYHFHENFNPYALLNENWTPNTIGEGLPAGLFAPSAP